MRGFKFNSRSKSRARRAVVRTPLVFGTPVPKEKKERHFPRRKIMIIFWLIAILVVLYYLLVSPAFQITDVFVEGNSLTSRDEIIAAIRPIGLNVFRFSSASAKQTLLKQFPQIKEIEIYKGIPNAIKIVVAEREGKIVWQTGNDFFLISSDGEVAKKIAPTDFKDLPHVVDTKALPVKPGSILVSPSFIAFIVNLNSNFFPEVNIKPNHFEIVETTFDVNLYTDAGFYVKFDSTRSSKKQLLGLKTILANYRPDVHEYVDLRIDGWAYYK